MSDLFQNTTPGEYKTLSPEDICVKVAFGRFDPPLAGFPHCIFIPSRARLGVIEAVTGRRLALFGGTAPKFEADGRIYRYDKDVIAEVSMWAYDTNREQLYDYYCGTDAAPFMIDANTPSVLLTRLRAIAQADYGADPNIFYNYDTFMAAIPKLLEELQFVYFPLEWEAEFALFATAQAHADWVDQVRKKIGPAAFALIRDGERWRWPPIHEDPQNRSSRVERRKHGW
jgi:hypothetical protein